MSIPDEYISFQPGFSIANSFNLQELLSVLIQFGFGVSDQCRRWCRVGCVLRRSEVTCMFWMTPVSFLPASRELSDLKQ